MAQPQGDSMRFMRLLSCAIALLLPVVSADAATRNWSTSFPKTGSVTIPAGDVVTLDTNVALSDLTIEGQVICADQNLSVSANWIMVHGLLQCGTTVVPHGKTLTITLNGAASTTSIMGMGTKFLGAMTGGKIELHGEARQGWTRLAATANKGATQITLKTAPAWRAGDSIVIASSDYRAEHAEERVIAAITGTTVTFTAPLAYQHWCATETFNAIAIEECAEVGLLSRNIVIRGDAQSPSAGFGGHVMVMSGASARISGVQFLNMGQKGRIGRYPMHWHLTGDAAGQYLDNSSIVHSYNRFLSVHGTHNVHLGSNVGYDTIGHGYYLEDGIERGNVIEDNLGLMVRNAADGLPTQSDKQAAVFWISNPDNTVRRNVAAGSMHTGFWLGFPEHPIGLSATTAVWPRRTPLKEFSGNVSHSNEARGLFVDGAEDAARNTITTWYEPRQNPADGTSPKVTPVFKTFVGYKNRFEAIWMRGHSNPVIQSARFADNGMGAYFASLSGTPGVIQDSLVVGETGNKGNPESWETKGVDGRELPHFWSPADSLRGLQFYDGPMTIRRTLFANFNSNTQRKAGALTSLSPNPFWISSLNTTKAISFLNANEVWLDPLTPANNGDAFSVFADLDGSVAGAAGRRIVPLNPALVTTSCTTIAQWNAAVCPINYVGVQMFSYGVDLGGSILKRNDGAATSLGNAGGNAGSLFFKVIENRPYSIGLPVVAPKRLTFNRLESAGKAARLSIAYPTANFTMTLWGSPIAKALSLDELSAGGTRYYYDTANQRLHMRLVSPTGGWQEYEINRP